LLNGVHFPVAGIGYSTPEARARGTPEEQRRLPFKDIFAERVHS